MKRLFYSLFFCLSCIEAFGMSWENTHYESYGEVDLRGATLAILPADQNISASDPKFTWFAQQAAPYFELHGATYVTSVDEAELVVLLDYGIGETTPRIYNKPIWGKKGIRSSTSTIRGNRISTTYTPSWGVIGYQQGAVNQYRKHVEMYLYETNTSQGMSLLWQASMEVVGSSYNLNVMFPAMMYKMGVGHHMICKEANGNGSIWDYEWEVGYNTFLQYSTKAISENFYKWRFLWQHQTELSNSTDQKHRAHDFFVRAYAICPNRNATVVFFVVFMKYNEYYSRWKLSDLSNFFIEYEGKRYYAKEAFGLKNGKKLYDSNHRTFNVYFDQLPEEVWYGQRYLTIKEEKKGKVLQGWDVVIQQE